MSKIVDSRVVEMRFDNQQFEQNARATMSTLDKLKAKLNFKGATEGLSEINQEAGRTNLNPLLNAVATVESKFSAMQVAAITALANITNSAVNAGKRIISALTIDPIKTGFQEYETQINAIQTILANTESKGSTLEDVNAALDELNTYADKTIYNFTEMTRNIGTFTAAGIDLDTSVSAIKGIANLAAVSGSTSQQASTAMYQLSQALSSGTVKLQDWNSVINAGMGGQVFQDALKETARVHGIAIDQMIEDEGSFRNSLARGWITSEILTETLSKFTGDLNEEQLRTMGYSEEQIKSIVKMGQTANDAATKVKTFTQLFDTLKEAAQSGWTQSWEIIVGDFEEAKELLTNISDVVSGVIGKAAEARNNLLQGWKDLGGRKKLIESFWTIWNSVASVLGTVKEAFREIFPPMTSEKLYKLTKGFSELVDRLKPSEELLDKIKRTFKGLFAVVDILKTVFTSFISAVFPSFSSGTKTLIDGFLGFTASVGDALVEFRDFVTQSELFSRIFGTIVSVSKKVWGGLKLIYDLLKEKIVIPLLKVINNLLGRTDDRLENVTGAVDRLNEKTNKFKSSIDKIKNSGIVKFLSTVLGFMKQLASVAFDKISGFLNGAADKLKEAKFSDILDVLNALLAGGLILALKALPKTVLSIFQDVKGVVSKATGALDTLVQGITSPFKSLANAIDTMSSKVNIEIIFQFCKAIAILAGALLVLSLIDSDKLAISIGAISVLFGELLGALALFTKIFQKNSGTIKDAVQQAKQLGAMVTMAKVLTKMAIAILILSVALAKLGSIDVPSLAKGLFSIGVLLTAVVGSMIALSNWGGDKVVKASSTILAIAMSLLIIVGVMKILSTFSWTELGKGMLGAIGMLAAVTTSLIFIGKAKGVGKGAVSLMVAATAILILAAALKIISTLGFGKIVLGILGLAGAIAVLAIAAAIIGPLAAVIMILAGAIALFGIGILACTTGILKFVAAMTLIGAVSEAAFAALVAGMSLIVIGIAQLIPVVVQYIAEGFVQIIETIGQNAGRIGQAILQLITNFCDIVITAMPKIMQTIGVVLNGIINLLVEFVPKISKAALQILTGVLKSLAEHIQEVTELAIEVCLGFINGVSEKLPDIIQSAIDLVISFIEGVAEAVGNEENIERLTNAVWDLAEAFITAFCTFIRTNFTRIKNLGKELMESNFIQGIKDKISGIWNAFKDGLETTISKIKGKWNDFKDAGKNLINGLKDGITERFSKIWTSVKESCNGLVDKVKDVFGIHSPSKVFEQIGEYLDKGLAVGIEKFSSVVNRSGKNMCVDFQETVQEGFGDLSDITSGIDSTPTITPVLDLSKVEEGAKRISGIFSNRQAIYAAAEEATNREARATGTTINMTINASEGQDVRQLADIIAERINNSVRRTANAWK